MAKTLYDIEDILLSINQQRDELKLQLHLAKAEVRDEWEKAERKLEQFKSKANMVRHEMEDVSGDVFSALKMTAEEIKNGYDRIRKAL